MTTELQRHTMRRIRALYGIATHASWPRYRHRDAQSPLVIGILDDPHLARTAREFLTGRLAHRRPLWIENYSDVESLAVCHLLYLGDCDHDTYQQARAFASGRQVLVVAEAESNLKPPPPIALYETPGRIRVDIDPTACVRSNVKLAPQLLALSAPPPSEGADSQ